MPRNNVGKQKRLDPRRRETYELRMQGKSWNKIAELLGPKYNVARTTLYQDWKHRDEWGDYVIPEPEEDKYIVQDALNRIDDLRAKMHEIINDPEATIKDKITAIGKLMKMEIRVLEAYQSLGKVHREATTIRIEEEAERIQKIVSDIAGDDIKTQEKVVGILLEYARSNTEN
jgi:hypothetical protein